MSCTDKPQSVLMQHISGVGCMQARSGLQSPHVPSCTPSSPSEDQEAQSTPSVVDTCSPSLVDLEAGSSSSMVDLSSPPLVDLESKSSSLVVDQDDAIPKNVGGAPVLGQNQAGEKSFRPQVLCIGESAMQSLMIIVQSCFAELSAL